MTDKELIAGVATMRAFVPSLDFELSKRFYADLGFEVTPISDGLADIKLGTAGSFLLQNFYAKDWAENFMVYVSVSDLASWWAHIEALDLAAKYGVQAPRPPAMQPHGIKTAFVYDPAGVLWHFAQSSGAGSGE